MANKIRWNTHADLAIKRNPSMDRDEYLAWMTFEGGERIPFTEIFGPIIGLKEEWAEQGASPEELDFSAFKYRSPKKAGVAVNTGRLGASQEKLSETADTVIYQDDLGRKLQLEKNSATLPLPISHTISNMDDWLKVKPKYEYSAARLGDEWEARAKAARDRGAALQAGIPGGFDEPRQLLGEENLCYAYYEQPELIHDMLKTISDMVFKVLDKVSSTVQVDILGVHEDMAGKSGPLAGPVQIEEFIKPYYRRIWDMMASRGVRLFDQDSDGDMNHVIPAFIDAGINCMHPMEPAANMDIVKVRQKYGGKLAFYGGLDKHILRRTKAEIAAELEYKIPPMIRTRGCMLGLDHRIPNGTPLENYRFYINKVWEIIEREEGQSG